MRLHNIFRSEIRYQLKNIVFWVFIIVSCLFANLQFNEEYGTFQTAETDSGLTFQYDEDGVLKLTEPEKNLSKPIKKEDRSNLSNRQKIEVEDYFADDHLTPEEEKAEIKRYLARDLWSKSFTRYRFFINQKIKLSNDQLITIEALLDEIDNMSYERLIIEVNQLDQLLGQNTIYGDKHRQQFLSKPLTPEEKAANFNFKVYQEGLTNAYGRLFADYLGITAGLFPVFITAFLLLRDHRFQMAELIRVRDVNALSYVWGKYLAVVVLLSGAYLLISCYPTFKFFQICQENDWIFHFWGFFKYTLAWVIPTMMFTVAIGMLIGQLTGSSLIVLVVQLILWFSNITTLSGNYSIGRFIIRFNSSDGYQLLINSLPDLWVNRIFFLIISVICVFLVALIWRHGKKNYVLPS